MSNREDGFLKLLSNGELQIKEKYPDMYETLIDEYHRQKNVLMMVASCSLVSPPVLACQGMIPVNITAEGYPDQRYHAGCTQIDKIENMAIVLAKQLFNANYANVQPHSATTANEIVMFSLLNANDVILGMDLSSGGHLSHGANVSYSGTYFNSIKYGLDKNFLIDLNQVESLAKKYRPKLIICGTTAYSRCINFKAFREIADRVGAYLLADISHISGLVATGLHESPINYAHITISCTHKQLFGPRGGIILSGKDSDMEILIRGKKRTLSQQLQKSVFPFFQGAPAMNLIAAKAMAFKLAMESDFRSTMNDVVRNSKILAQYFVSKDFDVISGGTDTHIVLLDLQNKGINGQVAERALEQCGIIVNKNMVPNSDRSSKIPAGIRIGTNILAQRKFSKEDVIKCGQLIEMVLANIIIDSDNTGTVRSDVKHRVITSVRELCEKNPINEYL